MSAASYEALVKRLEAVTARLEAYEPRGGSGAGAPATPAPAGAASGGAPALAAFDALLANEGAKLASAARDVGGAVQDATALLSKALAAERTVVATIVSCKQPSAPALQKLVAPVGAALVELSAKTEGKRTGEFNHFKALSEASQGLTWVAFLPGVGAPLPGAACDEAWAAAEFWVNKVLMEFRGKDDKQVAWAAALKALFTALRAYVKAHHAAGPAWNARGGDAADFKAGAAAPAGVSGGAPPPPPPPPPPGGPGSLIRDAAPAKPAGPNMNALFGEINKGENVASGLRKVTDDMKAKNRTDRSGAVPATAAPAAASAPGRGGAAPLGTPRLACEGGRKWVVEHQVDAKELRVTDVNAKQTVYVYNCRGSVVTIAGKVNSVCVDGCSRTAVVFADVVAAVEVVNCSAVELQATGVVPTVAVDNCNGVQLYLNAAAMACAITTAKSSAVNVLVPGKTADDDLVEAPIPEQFVTTFVKGKWLTEPVAHSAG